MAQESSINPTGLVMLVAAILAVMQMLGGGKDVTPDNPDKPDPVVPSTEMAESDVWEAMAINVERSTFPLEQQNTDHLVGIVDMLKASGSIKDDSRISAWRARRTDITDSNRAEIANTLRGK